MDFFRIFDQLWYFFSAFILLPIGYGLYRWQYLRPHEQVLVLYLVALLLIDGWAVYLSLDSTRNHFTYFFRTLALLAFSAAFYGQRQGRWPARLSALTALALPLEIEAGGFNEINTYTGTLACVLVALYAGIDVFSLTGRAILPKTHPENIYYDIGLLMMGVVGTLFMLLSRDFILTSVDFYFLLRTLRVMVHALAYVLFTIGFSRWRIVP